MSPEEASARPDPAPAARRAPEGSTVEFKVPVRDVEGKQLEELVVDSARLDRRVRPALIKEAVVAYQANRRRGTHETKTRGQVSGSNKKPWRQKGTGRARAGTRKSPLWRGGGIIFGPHPRDYRIETPRGKRRLALRSVLFSKFRDGQVVVVDGFKLEAPRTRAVAGLLRALGVRGRCLIGTEALDKNLVLSARNIPRLSVSQVKNLNALEVLAARTIVLTRGALEAVLAGGQKADRAAGAPAAAAKETSA